MDQFSGGGHRHQIERLDNVEAGFREVVQEFGDDEIAHRDTGLEHGAEQAPAYAPLSAAIKAGTRLAIWLSERI